MVYFYFAVTLTNFTMSKKVQISLTPYNIASTHLIITFQLQVISNHAKTFVTYLAYVL